MAEVVPISPGQQASILEPESTTPANPESNAAPVALSVATSTSGLRPLDRLFRNSTFLIMALVGAIAGLVVFQSLALRQGAAQSRYIGVASQMLVQSQKLAKDLSVAVSGDEAALTEVVRSRDALTQAFAVLEKGQPGTALEPSPEALRPLMAASKIIWEKIRDKTNLAVENTPQLFAVRRQSGVAVGLAPLLLAQSDRVVEVLVREQAPAAIINEAGRQRTLVERIARNVNQFSLGAAGVSVAITQIGDDSELFARTAKNLRDKGSERVRGYLDAVDATFAELQQALTLLFENVSDFLVAHESAQIVSAESDAFLDSIQELISGYREVPANRVISSLAWVFGLSIIGLLLLLGRAIIMDAKDRMALSNDENRQTQDAILKLLDEMSSLADGDLTVEAEVTDQITGAIADSVNYAVREMRSLVERINDASQEVATESGHTRDIAGRVAAASDAQVGDIAAAAAQVQTMAASMQGLSVEAKRSAEVAQGSMQLAKRGATSVRDTIRGMDEMRDRIQQTAKRIKRLGESSQQINDVVSLIDDLSDQTNVLSLNAAIQATMAGDAGRGFAVVADEVQRLADRSAEATKEIAELIQTIQGDIKQAVISMEEATAGAVASTKLADSAGQALAKIESVSEQLSKIISNMAQTANRQSVSGREVSIGMASIRQTTEQASQGVRQTATSVERLAALARELEQSVSGFRLPE